MTKLRNLSKRFEPSTTPDFVTMVNLTVVRAWQLPDGKCIVARDPLFAKSTLALYQWQPLRRNTSATEAQLQSVQNV